MRRAITLQSLDQSYDCTVLHKLKTKITLCVAEDLFQPTRNREVPCALQYSPSSPLSSALGGVVRGSMSAGLRVLSCAQPKNATL